LTLAIPYDGKIPKGKKLHLEHLPNEVLMHVIDYLDNKEDFCVASRVNKHFFHLLHDKQSAMSKYIDKTIDAKLKGRKEFYDEMGPTLKYFFPTPETIPTVSKKLRKYDAMYEPLFEIFKKYNSPILKGEIKKGPKFFAICITRKFQDKEEMLKIIICRSENDRVWKADFNEKKITYLIRNVFFDSTLSRAVHLEMWLKKILNSETCGRLPDFSNSDYKNKRPYKELPFEEGGSYTLWQPEGINSDESRVNEDSSSSSDQ